MGLERFGEGGGGGLCAGCLGDKKERVEARGLFAHPLLQRLVFFDALQKSERFLERFDLVRGGHP